MCENRFNGECQNDIHTIEAATKIKIIQYKQNFRIGLGFKTGGIRQIWWKIRGYPKYIKCPELKAAIAKRSLELNGTDPTKK